jgi:hypothetical protein
MTNTCDEQGGDQMIRVLRKNFQEAMVDELLLDSLIVSNRLIAFNRSDHWAVVGKDALRQQNTLYIGVERRRIVCGNDFYMK